MSYGVGHGHSLDLALLWLWCRPAAVALIRTLAWEPPHAEGAALQSKKKEREKERKVFHLDIQAFNFWVFLFVCFCFCLFRTKPSAYGGSQARDLIGAVAPDPTPQPQQRQILDASATYTTAHGNAGLLTH